jgi:uncharacterized protein YecE (DUF72 family)
LYDLPKARAVDYLAEYAKRYRMVEIDSWFYKIPALREVEEYAAVVASGGRWDKIIEPKPQLLQIAQMIKDLVSSGREVHVDVNNHYAGSATKTIECLKGFSLRSS